ncbi:16S rRNA (cytosine967-C5)-methyltransferase [Spiroplasma litorale]|uniref:16S rRNA (Cytosine967-C5)-methyltransferase n=1 Tax=Spiroplasma litorale TaxID=216942 RepID=A0A0K1W100_9MOLU|nr:16S rRNA (cytosine(967)-C(5))-methyltransferase RsmB [Spiroplasma litorale]AKX33843.1 16S rRNA (cytosine967-C5)-methyltransferase [Spiroplasma litorale]
MNPRFISLNILDNVIFNNLFANKQLNNIKNNMSISKNDIFFIFKLVYGVIQYKLYLEYVTNKVLKKEIKNNKIKIIIWMALFQLVFLNSKAYYVINEAVELSKKVDHNLSSFVNAVLRKLQNKEYWKVNIKNKKNVAPLKEGIPYWLFDQISKQYSIDIAKKWIEYVNKESNLYVRLNTLKISKENFINNYNDVLKIEELEISNNFFIVSSNLFETDLLKKGFVYIQDPLSGLACEILNPEKNSKILDMCCAPGGKLSYLSQLVNQEADITAIEINENKKNIIQNNLENLGILNININYIDAVDYKTKTKFDYILLDAPCTGYGVIKNKPEIRLRKSTNDDIQKLYNLQKKLLEKAYSLLSKGGAIVYSTCTINKNENEFQIDEFLKKHKKMKKVYEKQYFGFEYNTNGFYICKLIKSSV